MMILSEFQISLIQNSTVRFISEFAPEELPYTATLWENFYNFLQREQPSSLNNKRNAGLFFDKDLEIELVTPIVIAAVTSTLIELEAKASLPSIEIIKSSMKNCVKSLGGSKKTQKKMEEIIAPLLFQWFSSISANKIKHELDDQNSLFNSHTSFKIYDIHGYEVLKTKTISPTDIFQYRVPLDPQWDVYIDLSMKLYSSEGTPLDKINLSDTEASLLKLLLSAEGMVVPWEKITPLSGGNRNPIDKAIRFLKNKFNRQLVCTVGHGAGCRMSLPLNFRLILAFK